MNENPVTQTKEYFLENEKQIRELFMKLAEASVGYTYATQFAAVATLIAGTEYVERGDTLLFDTILAFARHIGGVMTKEDNAKN